MGRYGDFINLIPKPVLCRKTGETVSLSGKFSVLSEDERLYRALERSQKEFIANGTASITVAVEKIEPYEGYSLQITTGGVQITGNSNVGAFWGLQTLRQLVCEYGADCLPGCEIKDNPALRERGFYHDITRGKVPTLDTLKKLVDRLSYFKINSLQLYVEHAFAFPEYEGIVSEKNQLTADEILELDQYCYDRFIELIPSLSTFGHLYHLLQSDRYSHLCELENYTPKWPWFMERMAHHTIDAYNPQSIELIGSLIRQYAGLFKSKRFNICCDETFDLCNGRNKGKDKGEAYLHFLFLIIDEVQKCGKQVMMWGDILLNHPELLPKLPKDVIVLNWDYCPEPSEEKIATIAALNQPQILCCATWGWNDAIPALSKCIPNIISLGHYAKKYGALGILNTNWGDCCNIGGLEAEMYPMTVGAACAWNQETIINEEFERAASWHLYGDFTGEIITLLNRLAACHKGNLWYTVCSWQAGRCQVEFKPSDLHKRLEALSDILIDLIKINQSIDREIVKELMLADRSAKFFCSILLKALGEEISPPEPPEQWLADFAVDWRRKNKDSELPQIVDYIKGTLQQTGLWCK